MGRSPPTVRTNRALTQSHHGQVAFNGGHPLWARYYFDRAIRRDAIVGVNIGDFYRSKAQFDQNTRHDLESALHYHGLAKHYYKRALPRQTHDLKLLRLLSEEYQALASLSERPCRTQHFQKKADYYAQAVIDLSMDCQNQRRLEADLAQLKP